MRDPKKTGDTDAAAKPGDQPETISETELDQVDGGFSFGVEREMVGATVTGIVDTDMFANTAGGDVGVDKIETLSTLRKRPGRFPGS